LTRVLPPQGAIPPPVINQNEQILGTLTTANNTLDDGTGNATISKSLVVTVNTTVNGTLFPKYIQNNNSAREVTGTGSASLGSNCPAATVTAPYKWLQISLSDGSTVYIPCWK
jgi:hypothetical protein